MQSERQTSPPVPLLGDLHQTKRLTYDLSATWHTGRNLRVIFDCGLFPASYENMTSSTKPEVHNVSHSRQRRSVPRPHLSYTECLVKFGHVVLRHASGQTDKQRKRHTYINTLIIILRTIPGAKTYRV